MTKLLLGAERNPAPFRGPGGQQFPVASTTCPLVGGRKPSGDAGSRTRVQKVSSQGATSIGQSLYTTPAGGFRLQPWKLLPVKPPKGRLIISPVARRQPHPVVKRGPEPLPTLVVTRGRGQRWPEGRRLLTQPSAGVHYRWRLCVAVVLLQRSATSSGSLLSLSPPCRYRFIPERRPAKCRTVHTTTPA